MKKAKKRLTALDVARLSKTGNYHDGDGLYLRVRHDGSKSWAFRFGIGGTKTWMSIGPLRDFGLSDARKKVAELRNDLREGRNPLAERRERQAVMRGEAGKTFDEVADQYISAHKSGWKNAKHASQWASTIRTYASPAIGGKPVQSIGLDDILAVLKPIWETKPETASRLRGRIESVLDYARIRGWRTGDNPAKWSGYLEEILPARASLAPVKHHAALPWVDVPVFMRELRSKPSMSAKCLEFAILTAARSGEARGLRWNEIDMQAATWTVPAARMKAKREHRVPLSARALQLLTELADIQHQPDGLVFPGGKPGGRLSDVAVSKTLHSIVPGLTVHGFRSSLRMWVAEATSFPGEIGETALAHVNKNKVESAYLRGDHFDRRRILMTAWADYCGSTP